MNGISLWAFAMIWLNLGIVLGASVGRADDAQLLPLVAACALGALGALGILFNSWKKGFG